MVSNKKRNLFAVKLNKTEHKLRRRLHFILHEHQIKIITIELIKGIVRKIAERVKS